MLCCVVLCFVVVLCGIVLCGVVSRGVVLCGMALCCVGPPPHAGRRVKRENNICSCHVSLFLLQPGLQAAGNTREAKVTAGAQKCILKPFAPPTGSPRAPPRVPPCFSPCAPPASSGGREDLRTDGYGPPQEGSGRRSRRARTSCTPRTRTCSPSVGPTLRKKGRMGPRRYTRQNG